MSRRVRVGLLAGALALVALGLGASTRPGRRLFTSSAEERARERIARSVEFPLRASFSADGKRVAYSLVRDGKRRLQLLDLAASPPRPRQYETAEVDLETPVLSPAGDRILYTATGGVFVLEVLSGRTRRLVSSSRERGGTLTNFAWAPDGRSFVARVWRELGTVQRLQELIAIDATSGGITPLLRPGAEPLAKAPAAWSPDGATLAFFSGQSLKAVARTGGPPRTVAAFPEGSELAPTELRPDPPVWSPDGTRLAVSFSAGDCYRLALVEFATGALHELDPTECAFRASFTGPSHITYLRLGQFAWTPWARSLDDPGAALRPLGFSDGITYLIDDLADGRRLLLGQPAQAQRGLWLFSPAAPGAPELLDSGFDGIIEPRWASAGRVLSTPSSNDLQIPVVAWPRTCGDPRGRGPAVLVVHGAGTDYGPRFRQDIHLLAAAGLAVYAVNYRGSTGNGIAFRKLANDRTGQTEDVVRALALVRGQADVDPARVLLLIDSYATAIAYPALRDHQKQVFGVIEWFGDRIGAEGGAVPGGMPLFMATALRDERLRPSRDLAARWRREEVRVTAKEYDCTHDRTDASARTQYLLDTAAFIADQVGSCDGAD